MRKPVRWAAVGKASAAVGRASAALARASAAIGVAGWTLDRPAGAATIRDDVPDSQYIALGSQSQFAASGYVIPQPGYFASATLIAPDWVLTAAHAVTTGVNSTTAVAASGVSFGQGAAAAITQPAANAVAQVIVDPKFDTNSLQGNDLALLQLSTPITNVAPPPIYSSSLGTELGQTATIVGYGYTGTGLTGYSPTTLGTRRGITDVIAAFGGTTTSGGPGGLTTYDFTDFSSDLMLTDFEDPHNPSISVMGPTTPTPLEGASVPGDSGGGLFLSVGGQTYLAGVTSFIGVEPGNPLSANNDGHYGDYDGYTRLSTPDAMGFLNSILISNSTWSAPGNGSWDSLADWGSSSIPEFMQSTATFGGAIRSASTVTLDANWTVGTVTFNNTNSYTVAAGNGGSLILDNGGAAAAASLTDSSGSHAIAAPVVLNSNLLVTVSNAGSTMTISGPVSGMGGLILSGQGTLSLSGVNSYAGPTDINGGTTTIAAGAALPAGNAVTVGTTQSTARMLLSPGVGTVTLSSLTIHAGSTLDIANNTVAINYGSAAADPVAAIAAALTSGAAYGATTHVDEWNGTGIVSSTANAVAASNMYAVGYADGNVDKGTTAAANQLLIMYTLNGDAFLQGSVSYADLSLVAAHYGGQGYDWAGGNFLYNPLGFVGFADLSIVARNYGSSLNPPQSASPAFQTPETEAVPESSGAVMLVLGAVGIFARHWRRI